MVSIFWVVYSKAQSAENGVEGTLLLKTAVSEKSIVASITPQPIDQSPMITFADVQSHSDATSCWSVVNGSVYDLTLWISQHPGGAKEILKICGKDGTRAFEKEHSRNREAKDELLGRKIGVLSQS